MSGASVCSKRARTRVKKKRAGVRSPLPVLNNVGGAPTTPTPPRRSRLRRWRVASLTAVHILIAAHIAHWLIAERTLAPAVLSESMYTLEFGRINPGFALFAAALLATLIFGRFLCGWACHMGGLQDLCAWLMRRAGIRPRTFRSRLLAYIPLILALYMFVWPTFKREALAPALRAWWPAGLSLIGPVNEFQGLTLAMTTDDLWANLPGLAVAAPFLLICGVATVWFLGSRGFCRYGCPYGGLLAPAQRLAPGRVVVDPDRCDQCAKCTAACAAGVRVHEQVRDFGSVIDSRCVRSLDCIAVCPQDALSFGWRRPGARSTGEKSVHKEKMDLTWPQEAALFACFWLVFFAVRGVYRVAPMLMTVGVAACATFIAWKLWRLARDHHVVFHTFHLKLHGRIKPAGTTFTTVGLIALVLIAHSGVVTFHRWRAEALDNQVTISRAAVFSSPQAAAPPEQRRRAQRALHHYKKASGLAYGGMGLLHTPGFDTRMAWLELVLGRPERAQTLLRRSLDRNGLSDRACAQTARVMMLAGDDDEAEQLLERALWRRPEFVESRLALAERYSRSGRFAAAESALRAALQRRPNDPGAIAQIGVARLRRGSAWSAARSLQDAVALAPNDARLRGDLAAALLIGGDAAAAAAQLREAVDLAGPQAWLYAQRLAQVFAMTGQPERARAWRRRAERLQRGG